MDYSEKGKLGYEKTKLELQANCRQVRKAAIQRHKAKRPKCRCCKKVLPYIKRRNKFCSHSCAAKLTNFGRKRTTISTPRKCDFCGAPSAKNKYCAACIAKSRHINRVAIEHMKAASGVRAYLLRTRDHKCEICGRRTWMKKKIHLEVDHIDGKHKNNAEENLRLACPNCHAMTPTYKAKNKGNGRANRRTALTSPKNNQKKGVLWAKDFEDF